jgi:hypothetical protein
MMFSFTSTCVVLTITDGKDSSGRMTVIDSRGYNVGCNSGGPLPGPRDEERAIRVVEHN